MTTIMNTGDKIIIIIIMYIYMAPNTHSAKINDESIRNKWKWEWVSKKE